MANGADATARDNHVLLAAVHSNRSHAAQLFLEHGADASARGNICLKHAVHAKNINMALLLVVYGADSKELCAPCGSFFEQAKITFFLASLVLAREAADTKKWIYLLEGSSKYRIQVLKNLYANIIQQASSLGASRFVELQDVVGYAALYDTNNYPSWWDMYRKTFCDKSNTLIEHVDKGFIDKRFLQVHGKYAHLEDEFLTERCFYLDHVAFNSQVVEAMLFERIKEDACLSNMVVFARHETRLEVEIMTTNG